MPSEKRSNISQSSECGKSSSSAANPMDAEPIENVWKIFPFLYLGDKVASQDYGLLCRLRIRHVVNMAPETCKEFSHPKLSYLRSPILVCSGCSEIFDFFVSGVTFIESARSQDSTVLVHCDGGGQRAFAMVLCYTMFHLKRPLRECRDLLKTRYSGVQIRSQNLLLQVEKFQCYLYDKGHFGNIQCISSSSSSKDQYKSILDLERNGKRERSCTFDHKCSNNEVPGWIDPKEESKLPFMSIKEFLESSKVTSPNGTGPAESTVVSSTESVRNDGKTFSSSQRRVIYDSSGRARTVLVEGSTTSPVCISCTIS
mmetsp:Transcript_6771/g.11192  ORF Transcript_6771/g.11192 Transcript_6771/m.11192 type:complete len:313 (+) Transcript_6771:279-1217(+)|eukprot:jgi/Bigna1/66621/fgenesh1_pg.2_\